MALSVEKIVRVIIPFESPESAALTCKVLSVDKQLEGSATRKEITTDEADLLIKFYGSEMKSLRVAVNSFLKYILLVVETISQFNNNQ